MTDRERLIYERALRTVRELSARAVTAEAPWHRPETSAPLSKSAPRVERKPARVLRAVTR